MSHHSRHEPCDDLDRLQAGYREGIIAGKEASLQEGFDMGFANVGVPIGRELGNLRGIASALVAYLSEDAHDLKLSEVEEARAISTSLSQIRFSDIAPGDLEAEQHAREHINDDPAISQTEELSQKRDMEILEDMLSQLAAEGTPRTRPTREDVAKLKERLVLLSTRLTLGPGCTSCYPPLVALLILWTAFMH